MLWLESGRATVELLIDALRKMYLLTIYKNYEVWFYAVMLCWSSLVTAVNNIILTDTVKA